MDWDAITFSRKVHTRNGGSRGNGNDGGSQDQSEDRQVQSKDGGQKRVFVVQFYLQLWLFLCK